MSDVLAAEPQDEELPEIVAARDNEGISFAVYDRETGKPLRFGKTSAKDIDKQIGDPETEVLVRIDKSARVQDTKFDAVSGTAIVLTAQEIAERDAAILPVRFAKTIEAARFEVADLPDADPAGQIVWAMDAKGGYLAVSDGVDWLKIATAKG